MRLSDLFGAEKAVIGMVHLLPLPGSPGWGGSMDAVLHRAVSDARTWAEGGAHALIVENFGDVPFLPGRVEPHTVAAMSLAARSVRDAAGLPVGVNVLRNDARAALGIAAALDLPFIRVNVHTGAMLTDQGILEGRADETLRLRAALGISALIFADVMVKHAVPLAPADLERVARDTFCRGLADALIVSGAATGEPTDLEDLRRVKRAAPDAPLLVGSGVGEDTIADLLSIADAVIVGTSAKESGIAARPVSLERVRRLVERAREPLPPGS
ncbi:MAG: BtpA/SgcQ family protein [Armatimonadetes bacterium]|nr:BtpA/SgcQ family protein [Armatimonadota bacterium]